jgi:hypothetical protein
MPIKDNPTYAIGIAMFLLNCGYYLLFMAYYILAFVFLASYFTTIFILFMCTLISIPCLVTWIIYWVKVNEYKNKIKTLPAAVATAKRSKYFTT